MQHNTAAWIVRVTWDKHDHDTTCEAPAVQTLRTIRIVASPWRESKEMAIQQPKSAKTTNSMSCWTQFCLWWAILITLNFIINYKCIGQVPSVEAHEVTTTNTRDNHVLRLKWTGTTTTWITACIHESKSRRKEWNQLSETERKWTQDLFMWSHRSLRIFKAKHKAGSA